MINLIKGKILGSNDQSVNVFVDNVGIGFEIFVTHAETYIKNSEIMLHTYMHWNPENGPTLYGFLHENEKKIFLLVISCSGIGPKIGMAVVAQITPNEFLKAIHEQDIKALSSVNGIGQKKAEQIILQLKHKVAQMIETGNFVNVINSPEFKNLKNVSDVLSSLNYSRTEIGDALEFLKNNSQTSANFDQLLRQALSYLSKRV